MGAGRIEYLEAALLVGPNKLEKAMDLFRRCASGQGLLSCVSQYVSRTPDRRTLRFTADGDPPIEQAYRTHRISPALPEA
jgi:hypothetical protein